MTDTEKCAHDLAVAFVQNLHRNVEKLPDEPTLEFRWQDFIADYEDAYSYFKFRLNRKP